MTRVGDDAQRNRIIDLAKDGVAPRLIQRDLTGLSREQIYSVIRDARAAGIEIPKFRTGREPGETADARTILFDTETLAQLEPHARKRGVHVNVLVRRIIETVLDDEMIDAVLDDASRLNHPPTDQPAESY